MRSSTLSAVLALLIFTTCSSGQTNPKDVPKPPTAEMDDALGRDQGFACQAYGNALTLDDTDFKALAESKYQFHDLPPGKGITKQVFASLATDSSDRLAICKTRTLWRLIKTGKTISCGVWADPGWKTDLFGDSELHAALAAETDAALSCSH